MSVTIVRRALLTLSLFALTAAAIPARAADVAVPQADREAIEAIVKKKIADLAGEKDAAGIGIKRGTFSKSFKKLTPTSYLVAFHTDTIEPKVQPDTDQMKTERHALTFNKGGDGKWTIAKDELKDTYVGLYRGYFGGDMIYRFDALSFEKEGLKVKAGPGWAFGSARLGKMNGWTVFADDLRFDYTPPADTAETSHYSALNKKLAKDHPEDLVFRPERLAILCDGATCDDFASTVFTGLKKVGAGGGDGSASFSRMQKRLNEALDEDQKNRRDNAFIRFTRKDEEDNRFWRFSFKRDGAKEHYASLTYDNYDPWQMSYFVSGYQTLYAYYSEDTRNKGIDPLVLEERGDEESRDFDLVGLNGAVDLMLEDPSAYSGDVTFKQLVEMMVDADLERHTSTRR